MEPLHTPPRPYRQRLVRGAWWFFKSTAVVIAAWLWFPIVTLAAHRYQLLPASISPSGCLSHHSRFFAGHPEFFSTYRRTMQRLGALGDEDYWRLTFIVRAELPDAFRHQHECGIGCAALHGDTDEEAK